MQLHAAPGARVLARAPGDGEQRIALVHEGPFDRDLAGLQYERPVALPALADDGAHAIALIRAHLRLVGGVEYTVGEHQQVADGIALRPEIDRGLADRPFDDFDLFGGENR